MSSEPPPTSPRDQDIVWTLPTGEDSTQRGQSRGVALTVVSVLHLLISILFIVSALVTLYSDAFIHALSMDGRPLLGVAAAAILGGSFLAAGVGGLGKKRWARVTMIVLAALFALGGCGSVIQHSGDEERVISGSIALAYSLATFAGLRLGCVWTCGLLAGSLVAGVHLVASQLLLRHRLPTEAIAARTEAAELFRVATELKDRLTDNRSIDDQKWRALLSLRLELANSGSGRLQTFERTSFDLLRPDPDHRRRRERIVPFLVRLDALMELIDGRLRSISFDMQLRLGGPRVDFHYHYASPARPIDESPEAMRRRLFEMIRQMQTNEIGDRLAGRYERFAAEYQQLVLALPE